MRVEVVILSLCGVWWSVVTRSMLYFSLVNIQSEEKMLTHALCPYDKDGNWSDRFYTCLDLTAGSKIKLRNSPHSKVTVKY